jgi:hypothetical protein
MTVNGSATFIPPSISISLNHVEGGPILGPTANNLSVTGSGPPVGGALTGLLQ